MDEFVTVKTVNYPHELLVVQSILEGEGIETFVKDELTVQMNPLYSNAIGGIKLQVGRDDAERALQILADTGQIESTKTLVPELNNTEMHCPQCKSDNISPPTMPRWSYIISILTFGFPVPFQSTKYHCFDCGLDFKKKDLKR